MTVRTNLLPAIDPGEVRAARPLPIDADTRAAARDIVDRVATGGEAALREFIERFEARPASGPLVVERDDLAPSVDELAPETRAVLERVTERVSRFARAQRATITDLDTAVDGGRAGHEVAPVASAGCYAPGGRYPLPSSVIMTAATARAAGVERVVVASPDDSPVMRAAAYLAGADAFLHAGGAQAIAALAHGVDGVVDPVDVVVGPGNRWVTAAKEAVYGTVGIDLPAGPSELVVVADGTADVDTIAVDLIAQAEHDPDARPILVALDDDLVESIGPALERALAELSTESVARESLRSGFVTRARDRAEARRLVDVLAPEHLEVCVAEPREFARGLRHYGAAFLGEGSAEVLGDYGVGPNHVLPTGGAARFTAGLSVFTFLRTRTWLEVDDPGATADDAAALAALEGLDGHRLAATYRSRESRSRM